MPSNNIHGFIATITYTVLQDILQKLEALRQGTVLNTGYPTEYFFYI